MPKDNLEKDVLDQLNKNKYIRIGSDVSVTELIDSPRIVHLRNRHRDKLVSDNFDINIPSLVGQGLHRELQKYLKMQHNIDGNWLIERKMCSVFNNIRLAGKFDALWNLKHLYDIKYTGVFKYIKGDWESFEAQLNIYDYMLHMDGIEIEKLFLFVVFSDWKQGKVYKTGYPKHRKEVIEVKKWSRVAQKDFIVSRLKAWEKNLNLKDNKLTLCTPEERWAGNPVYKLFKAPVSKRSTKNFPTRARAENYKAKCIANSKDSSWDNSFIDKGFPQPWKRCEGWCDVKDFCNQYKEKLT